MRFLRSLLLALALAVPSIASAQSDGPPFYGRMGPIPQALTSANVLAKLALTSGHIYVGSASNHPADVALSGDCSMANTGAITCTKTGGVSFGYFATGTDAGNLTGATLAAAVTASSLKSFGTLGADLLFTDATYDIGKSGATRPRDGFFSRNLAAATLAINGATIGTKKVAVTGDVDFDGGSGVGGLSYTAGTLILGTSVRGVSYVQGATIIPDSAGSVTFGGGGSRASIKSSADGVIDIFFNNGTTYALTNVATLQSKGTVPTPSGTCSVNTQTGGATAGTFKANGICAAGTVILTFGTTAATGWACDAIDRTTPTDLITQTASSQTTATFSGTLASNDVVQYKCMAY